MQRLYMALHGWATSAHGTLPVRRTRPVTPLVAAVIAGLAVSSCGGGGDGFVKPTTPPVLVVMTPGSASVNVGSTTSFAVNITGGSTNPTLSSCTSQNISVATTAVTGTSCTATGIAAGTTGITARASDGTVASAQLTVVALAPAITAFTLTPATAVLPSGQTVRLVATSTTATGAVVTVSYQSSNTAVATVSANGVVTGVGAGSATITATAQASGTNLATTSLSQTSVITVTTELCAPSTVTLPISGGAIVNASSCIISADIQRRGEVLRINLATPAAIEVRFTSTGFNGYLTLFPAADPEFVFFTSIAGQELRRTWALPPGLTELRIGTAFAGQSGGYTFSAAPVSSNVTGCNGVVIAGSLQSSQTLSSGDCLYNGRLADEFGLFSTRPCVITMNRDTPNPMTNPYLEVYAGGQLYASDNDGGINGNARISLTSCKSAANEVLTVRATSFAAGDVGSYVISVVFGQ